MTVSLVARRHGVAPNQLFTWRRLVVEGALTAAGSGEQVVPASDYRALQSQVRELQRLLGKKTLEAEILKEALEYATGSKNGCGVAVAAEGRFLMKSVAEVIGVSRANLIERMRERAKKRIGRPPLPPARVCRGDWAGSSLHNSRSRRFRRYDESHQARPRFLKDEKALSHKGQLPGDLLARCECRNSA
jgi:Transposase